MSRSAKRASTADPHDEASFSEPPASEPLECIGVIHILVIDDDDMTCRVIRDTLDHKQLKVHIVSDPTRVESTIRHQSDIKLVILDYMQPGLTHEQVLAWLQESHPDSELIVISGYPSVEGVHAALRARAYDYITKPFDLGHLRQTVMKCLESRGWLRMKTAALRQAVGTVIRDRRKELNLTLGEMATKTGISLGYLSQIELGKNSPSIDTLYRVSVALGLRLSELFSEQRF
jgi:DNA-binding response OmpR family regulator